MPLAPKEHIFLGNREQFIHCKFKECKKKEIPEVLKSTKKLYTMFINY